MEQYDNVERAVIDAADTIAAIDAKSHFENDREWTKRLLTAISEVGHKRGYYVCCSSCPTYGEGEWLYDMVWLKHAQDAPGYMTEVPLILEPEWNGDLSAIDDDFMKLLLGRAQHRVMVFQHRDRQNLERITRHLVEQIRAFEPTQRGDRYLFLGWDGANKKFRPELFVN
ncbi:MAG TPA: hypothetical protein VGU20_08655 [Stellaceae bacterium]|nr:hypothetical protein [Stellaceae bacterium]